MTFAGAALAMIIYLRLGYKFLSKELVQPGYSLGVQFGGGRIVWNLLSDARCSLIGSDI